MVTTEAGIGKSQRQFGGSRFGHPSRHTGPKRAQQEALQPSKTQRVFLCTDIAETSITIDGVGVVVDSGLRKEMFYNPRSGMHQLRIVMVSKSTAQQRAGRAGRTRPGICFRLYSEQTFLLHMPESPVPSVQLEELTDAVLKIKASGVRDIKTFPWPSPPTPDALMMAAEELTDI
ncbi:P-loop containing nucleoside triphosphate hydrolase protein [Coniochaeta ligniaria NRRL 30616]|uniref:p-loop containing nucleoside triphosphate hydrolase protein n=1 Tax=Coniochaeta ligniaria NRRL 30616 TaxID=1408157 RepID=A0A1J7IUU9_9PEZI|nr:P-loop containing nucleoside triphosphate hydrolase protein [Coniochaeta ligniaria NRRL 30616]